MASGKLPASAAMTQASLDHSKFGFSHALPTGHKRTTNQKPKRRLQKIKKKLKLKTENGSIELTY